MLTKLILAGFVAVTFSFISCNSKETGSNSDTQKQIEKKVPDTKVPVTNNKDAADFSWNEDGKDDKLSNYKGKVVLVNFWATWCPPCKKELPALSQISTDLKDKDFKMVGVSVDDQKSTLDEFLKVNKLSYTIVHEPTDLVEKFMKAGGVNENVIPQTYIINKDGKIVESIIGSRSKEDFMKLINKYL